MDAETLVFPTQQRRLSSVLTPLFKFGFSALWIGGGAALLAVVYARQALPIPLVVLWLFVSVIAWLSFARLKAVSAEGPFLVVSNYHSQERIPLAWIEDVTEHRWIKTHPVTIHFDRDTAFGRSVVFMPPPQLLNFRKHPVVEELLGLARKARLA